LVRSLDSLQAHVHAHTQHTHTHTHLTTLKH
jgi:hypothetical protein